MVFITAVLKGENIMENRDFYAGDHRKNDPFLWIQNLQKIFFLLMWKQDLAAKCMEKMISQRKELVVGLLSERNPIALRLW